MSEQSKNPNQFSIRELLAVAATAGAVGGLIGAYAAKTWSKKAGCGQHPQVLPTSQEWWREEASNNGSCPHVVLVSTGSVASVKVPELALTLSEFADVIVVFTSSGGVMASRDVSGRYAPQIFDSWASFLRGNSDSKCKHRVRMLRDSDEWDGYEDVSGNVVVHIELRKWADVAIVAPCSANTLAKVSLGLCDNLATSFLRAWDPEKPLLVAPAMNTTMWQHPSTAEHLGKLEQQKCGIIPPASKRLACGDVGRGALAPVAEIVTAVKHALEGYEDRRKTSSDVSGSWQRLGFSEWTPK